MLVPHARRGAGMLAPAHTASRQPCVPGAHCTHGQRFVQETWHGWEQGALRGRQDPAPAPRRSSFQAALCRVDWRIPLAQPRPALAELCPMAQHGTAQGGRPVALSRWAGVSHEAP